MPLKYDAPAWIQEPLNKYRGGLQLDGQAFKIEGATFGVDRRIACHVALRVFMDAVVRLLNLYREFEIPHKLANVYLLIDEDIPGGCQVDYPQKDGAFWNLIFLPAPKCRTSELFFLLGHELTHAWAECGKDPSAERREIFTELVATVYFKRMTDAINSGDSIYRSLALNPGRSYLARDNEVNGRYAYLLIDPEAGLRHFLNPQEAPHV